MTNPRYDEQFRRGYSGPPVQPPAGEDRVVDESSGVSSPDVDGLGSDIASARPFRRNPFAIALLAAGVFMLIVGVWLVEQSSKLYTEGYTSEQLAVTQIQSQLAAPVLTSGVIAMIAWLVLGAIIAAAHRRGA